MLHLALEQEKSTRQSQKIAEANIRQCAQWDMDYMCVTVTHLCCCGTKK